MNDIFKNKNILITGGTGSFGKELVNTLLTKHNPNKIIIFSRDELKQYELANKLRRHEKKLRFFIGDIRDYSRLNLALEGVHFVVHAAALKQVPTAEYNPFETVKTNIMGSQNVISACLNHDSIESVVALSTDKAAAPINLYGATKLTADKLFINANHYKGKRNIKFSVVRYGNVFGSRGSVVPFFHDIKSKGEIPITDKNMTRFNIMLSEGVSFVINSFKIMVGGELFVPKIPSYNILDMAKAIAPECKLNFIGIRAGEKIHEEMITESDSFNTFELDNLYIIASPILVSNIKNHYEKNKISIKKVKPRFKYNSGENDRFLTVEELRNLYNDFLKIQ